MTVSDTISAGRAAREARVEQRKYGLLKDQVAVVTGASSGIGRAIACALADQGAQLCLVARRKALLEALATDLRGSASRCEFCSTDMTSDADLQVLAGQVQREFDGVDVLVLCGGAISHGNTGQSSLEEFDLLYRSNLRAHYALIQLLLPSLRQRQGQIVFVNSSAGIRPPSAGAGQFAATQHGLRAIADAVRDEVNGDGMRVLSIYPGRTATPRMEAFYNKRGLPYQPELLMQPQDVAAMVIAALSLPRTAEVTDISMRPMKKSY
jgi:NADP-dependent 3-hydroxy acid dehydrogenase YdfG